MAAHLPDHPPRRRRDRPHAGDRLQAPRRFLLARNPLDHFVERLNPPVQPRQVPTQLFELAPEPPAQPVLHILAYPQQGSPQRLSASQHDNPVFAQQPSYLLARGRTLPHPLTANTMNRLDVLLFHAFDRHKSHGGSSHGLTEALGIVGVILLALHIRLDKLRRNQAYRVPHPLKNPAPSCALAHASMPIKQGSSFSKNPGNCFRDNCRHTPLRLAQV